MRFKNYIDQHREIAQIIYGVVLIILIPLLISYNTISIISKYNQSIDVTLQRQALSLVNTINALISDELNDHDKLQDKIENIKERDSDIIEISVLIPQGDDFIIIAADNQNIVGENINYYYYNVAWAQKNSDALVTDSIKLSRLDKSTSFQTENNERFWLVTKTLTNEDGKKIALLSLNISSEIVDQLTESNRNSSLLILFATIIITILFLVIAVRLWDYVLLYKKIKELDKMKNEFISIASHELRTPITSIKGYSSMVLDGTMGKINDDVKNAAKVIKDSSVRLGTLVEDLLNVSRIEQNRIQINLQVISPKKIIEEAITELKVQAKNKNLSLKFLPHNKKLPLLNIDPEKLKQILINLIGNSIKYTNKGGIEIKTQEKENKFLEIIIKDTGIGMTSKEKEKLFQKFYRVKNEDTEKITGTGLGLWITKELVEMMDGKITLDSIKDVGTQINLIFKIEQM
ncbi:hypothetical protein C0583_06060 [Candidatus Parcubacteria bacterium]|nr:MAG: hypothetical protein C0583_06060 [Candidatus Parcubacteria bacterium]